jgi:AcrR family transcriptional regulator
MTQRKSKEIRKKEILEAALACFSRKGYHDTKMNDIIKRCGLSKGALYWYFKGKRDIFIALMEQHIHEDKLLMQRLTDEYGVSPSLLKQSGQLFLERHFSKEKAKLVPLFIEFIAESSRDTVILRKLRAIYGEWIELIKKSFETAKAQGMIRDLDTECLAMGIFALVDGLIGLHIVFGEQLDYHTVWNEFSDALLKGIIKRGKR